MRLSNNTVFTSTTALFDETLYPKCPNAHVCGTIRVNEPRAQQPPHDANEDTIPDDLDDIPIPPTKKEPTSAEPDGANTSINIEDDKAVPQPPPPVPDPVPLHRSTQLRKVPTHSGNIYRKDRHPTKIETDMQRNCTWRQMTENQPDSFKKDNTSGPCTINQPSVDPSVALNESAPAASEDEVDDILHLAREGGVEFLNYLLTKAVPSDGSESPNTSNT